MGKQHTYIFVDFDDTLCLHVKRLEQKKALFCDSSTAADYVYKDSILNQPLHDWLKDSQEHGASLILITEASSMLLDVKKAWVLKNCGDLGFDYFISTSMDLDKADHLERFEGMHPDSKILFVDDRGKERAAVSNRCRHVMATSPQYIMSRQYSLMKSGSDNGVFECQKRPKRKKRKITLRRTRR